MKEQFEVRRGVVDGCKIKVVTKTKGDVTSYELKSQSRFENIVVECTYCENPNFEKEFKRLPMSQKVVVSVLNGKGIVHQYQLYAQNRYRAVNGASYTGGETPLNFYYHDGKIQFPPLNKLLQRINDRADLFTVGFVNATNDMVAGYVIMSTPEYILDIKNQLPVTATNIEQGKNV